MASYVTVSVSKGPASVLPWSMYQVEVDWTFAKLLEVVQARLTAGILDENEELKCYLSQEMKPCLSSRMQVILGFNVVECCRINGKFISYVYPAARECVTP